MQIFANDPNPLALIRGMVFANVNQVVRGRGNRPTPNEKSGRSL
jgi:hypothetical protein